MTSLLAQAVSLTSRLSETDLSVEAGKLVALVGPNGGGKTSLLRALARVDNAGGQVRINGEDLDEATEARRRRLLAFLPASRDLGWPIASRDVIALGLDGRDDDRIDHLIATFELESLSDRPIDRLSTGERARVLTARALAARPQVLLLDEPLSNLDPYWVLRFLEIFREAGAAGQTLLVALHDLSLLPQFNRALLLAGGKVQMDEAPADLMASERFEEIFRIRAETETGWQIRR